MTIQYAESFVGELKVQLNYLSEQDYLQGSNLCNDLLDEIEVAKECISHFPNIGKVLKNVRVFRLDKFTKLRIYYAVEAELITFLHLIHTSQNFLK